MTHLFPTRRSADLAERRKLVMRVSDTVARLAGDEFVILAPGLRTVDDAAQLAQKLIDCFAQPLAIPGHHIVSRLSVGVTLYSLDESGGESLLRHDDMATYQATQDGRSEASRVGKEGVRTCRTRRSPSAQKKRTTYSRKIKQRRVIHKTPPT